MAAALKLSKGFNCQCAGECECCCLLCSGSARLMGLINLQTNEFKSSINSLIPATLMSGVRRPSAVTVPSLWIGAWNTPAPLLQSESLGGVSPSCQPERVPDTSHGTAAVASTANIDGSGISTEADGQGRQDFRGWLSFRSTLGSIALEIRTYTFAVLQ